MNESQFLLRTYEENGFGGWLAVDLLYVLWLEGDQANKAVDSHKGGKDNQRVDSVSEESLQRWNEIWWSAKHIKEKRKILL